MTAPVVRDIDIVSQSGTFGKAEVARAENGAVITVLNNVSTPSAAAINAALVAAGEKATVVLSGTFNTTGTLNLQRGQTVIGAGNITVRNESGRSAILKTPGATINANTATNSIGAVTMADNTTLRGMVINQTQNPANVDPRGVTVNGRSHVTIADNNITVTAANGNVFGTYIIDSNNIIVQGNTISSTRIGATAIGLYANNSSVKVAGNNIGATGNTAYAAYLVAGVGHNIVIMPDSDNNVFLSGSCGTSGAGTFSGALGYIMGGVVANCP